MDTKLQKLCAKCGSDLVQLTQVVTQAEHSAFPKTVTKFRCTNTECQAEIDRKTEELIQQRLERLEKASKRTNQPGSSQVRKI